VVRLLANGTVDPSFNAGLSESDVYTIVIQPDGRILVGGTLRSTDGTQDRGIRRLNADGSIDPTFILPFDDALVSTILLQADGRILVHGELRLPDRGVDILRLEANGTIDESFAIARSFSSAVAQQDDGRILLEGDLPAPATTRGITRYAQREEAFDVLSLNGRTIHWRRAGALQELADEPVLEISTSNGASFTPIGRMQRVSGGWQLDNFDPPVGQAFLLRTRGHVRSGIANGSSSYVQTTARLIRPDRVFRHGFE
jgi:uncharacterized delta-60 repeat protein